VLCQGEDITPDDLPAHLTGSKPSIVTLHDALLRRRSLNDIEREYTLLALDFTEGRKKEAAELLDIDRKTLYRKLEEYGRMGGARADSDNAA
jgi:DNA-binding NtrC family response regulator